MKTNRTFNFKRFFLLLRNDLLRNYRTLPIAAGAVAAIYFISTIPAIFFSSGSTTQDFHIGFYPMFLFIGGFLLSSAAFSEIHQTQKNVAFFMLPASTVEKYASKLLLTSPGYAAASLALYYLLSLLTAGIAAIFTDWSFPIFNPFTHKVLTDIAVYLVTQSLFLFGGLYFKKHPFMKTLFAQFGIAVVLGVFVMLVLRIVYHDFFHGTHFFNNYIFNDVVAFERLVPTLSTIIKYLFWIGFAPYFWILGYLRLREAEV